MKPKGISFLFLSLIALSCGPSSQEKQTIIRDDAEINYQIYGDGGATILFIHGAFADQTYWKEQIEFFQDDYTVVTVDLPGHGKSGKGRKNWSVRGFADDIYSLIKRLNLKDVVLVGHSMGADVALMEATYRPKSIKGIVVVDNFKNAATKPSKATQKLMDDFLRGLKMNFTQTSDSYVKHYLVSDSTPVAITQKVSASFTDAYRPMAHQIYPQLFGLHESQKKLLPELDFKLHLINVSNTETNEKPLEKYAKKGYALKQIEGTSHYPMLENPAEFNRILQETLDEISRESSAAPAY
jgi:pimeloyl-ACP methyl ester carboxylesterase